MGKEAGPLSVVQSVGGLILSVTSALINHPNDFFVELGLFHQSFQRDVHAPAPVVAWIGRYVDTFAVHIRVTQLFVHGSPVLPGQYTQHGRRLEVVFDDFRLEYLGECVPMVHTERSG